VLERADVTKEQEFAEMLSKLGTESVIPIEEVEAIGATAPMQDNEADRH
jgi:hypothetical protein